MNVCRCCAVLLLFFFASSLFGAEGISALLDRWFAVESALYDWQGAAANAAVTDGAVITADAAITADGTEAEKLFLTLEQFRLMLEDFTGSLLFLQYEGTGLLPEESGKTVSRMTSELSASLKKAVTAKNFSDTLNVRAEIIPKAAAIRGELYFWSEADSQISSRVFSRFAYIFGVFSVCVVFLIVLVWFLYWSLRRSRLQEQDSTDFSRITMLVQEKERAFISAELHDSVLQDMGRLLQMSKESLPPGSFSEMVRKIMIRTRELCMALMPPDFSRLALADSLVQLCADFEKRTSVECRAIIAPDFSAGGLSPQLQLQVYRVVQESLANIEKHAQAAEVTLTVRNKEDRALLICVTDDGKGIGGERINPQGNNDGGLGIRGLYQRAAMLGASLSFIPGAGSGLTVRLEIPFS